MKSADPSKKNYILWFTYAFEISVISLPQRQEICWIRKVLPCKEVLLFRSTAALDVVQSNIGYLYEYLVPQDNWRLISELPVK
jgi:hypothetical protein